MGDAAKNEKNGQYRYQALLNMQEQYLQALRSRESEVLQFITLFVSALGGFAWVLERAYSQQGNISSEALYYYIPTIMAILLILTLGATHTLALGYNYRSVVLQLRNVERKLDVESVILKEWIETSQKYKFKLPEMLKVFFVAYCLGIILVTTVSVLYALLQKSEFVVYFILPFSLAMMLLIIHIYNKYNNIAPLTTYSLAGYTPFLEPTRTPRAQERTEL